MTHEAWDVQVQRLIECLGFVRQDIVDYGAGRIPAEHLQARLLGVTGRCQALAQKLEGQGVAAP